LLLIQSGLRRAEAASSAQAGGGDWIKDPFSQKSRFVQHADFPKGRAFLICGRLPANQKYLFSAFSAPLR
jgi:hypothetical protein